MFDFLKSKEKKEEIKKEKAMARDLRILRLKKEIEEYERRSKMPKQNVDEDEEYEDEEEEELDDDVLESPKKPVKILKPIQKSSPPYLPQPIKKVMPKPVQEVKIIAIEKERVPETEPGFFIPGVNEEGNGMTQLGALQWVLNKVLELEAKLQ